MKKPLLAAPRRARLQCWQRAPHLDWKIFHYWTNEPLVHTWNLFQCIKTLKSNSGNSDSVFPKKNKIKKQMQNYRPYIWLSQQPKPEIHIIKLRFHLLIIIVTSYSTPYAFRLPIFPSKAENCVISEWNTSLRITSKGMCVPNTEPFPNISKYVNHLNYIIKLC